jgi:hypothetical protein
MRLRARAGGGTGCGCAHCNLNRVVIDKSRAIYLLPYVAFSFFKIYFLSDFV